MFEQALPRTSKLQRRDSKWKSTVCKGLVETLTYRMPLRVKLRVATSNAGPV